MTLPDWSDLPGSTGDPGHVDVLGELTEVLGAAQVRREREQDAQALALTRHIRQARTVKPSVELRCDPHGCTLLAVYMLRTGEMIGWAPGFRMAGAPSSALSGGLLQAAFVTPPTDSPGRPLVMPERAFVLRPPGVQVACDHQGRVVALADIEDAARDSSTTVRVRFRRGDERGHRIER